MSGLGSEMAPWLKHLLRSVLLIGVASYVGFALLVFFLQSRFVYYPTRTVLTTPAAMGLAFEDVRLTTEDGETIAGWYVAATGPPRGTSLCFHGNGGNIGDRVDTIKALNDLGMNVLMIDYRGYGQSTGKPTEDGTYRDAHAAWNYLTGVRGEAPSRIAIHGRSLGCAVAARLAADRQPGALVLESPFASVPDMARVQFPWLPTRLCCRFNYDVVSSTAAVKCPVLVAHSPRDEMVPFEQGRRVFEAAPGPKRFVELSGSHNDWTIELPGSPARKALGEFLTDAFGAQSRLGSG